ncbi:MAG: hypothetical protein ABR561_02500 [Guyparkeria sp.]
MLQNLQRQLARHRRLVGLLCLVMALQSLWCCTWHVHVGHEGSDSDIVHLEHADSHADAVEFEPAATLKAFGDGLGLFFVLALLIALPRLAAVRPPAGFDTPPSYRPHLRPPGRAPPLA